MRLKIVAAACCVSCSLFPVLAKADTFAFTIAATQPTNTGAFLSSTGTITAVPDATVAGALDVTAITGTVNGAAITGTVPSNFTVGTVTYPDTFYFTYDNLLFPAGPQLFDDAGLAFKDANGVAYNVSAGPNGLVYEAFNGDLSFDQQTFFAPAVNVSLTDTTAITPEPSSMVLLGTGLLGLAGLLRRRA